MVIITAQDAAERLSPVFKGRKGKLLFDLAAGLTGVSRINALHDRVDKAGVPYGAPFAKGILDDIGVLAYIAHRLITSSPNFEVGYA